MGVARLLAKGWVVFCLFAGAYALERAHGGAVWQALPQTALIVALFAAMGLLFIGGYASSSLAGNVPLAQRFRPHHVLPGFNEVVFMAFALLGLAAQMAYLPDHVHGGILGALQSALDFAVPGQHELGIALANCGLDGGRMFASAFAWLLAFIYLGSALSHIRLAAGIVRLERKVRPEALTPTGLALMLGVVAVVGIQLLFVGSLFPLLPCSVLQGISGEILGGIAPLMLSYLIAAALTNLVALGPET